MSKITNTDLRTQLKTRTGKKKIKNLTRLGKKKLIDLSTVKDLKKILQIKKVKGRSKPKKRKAIIDKFFIKPPPPKPPQQPQPQPQPPQQPTQQQLFNDAKTKLETAIFELITKKINFVDVTFDILDIKTIIKSIRSVAGGTQLILEVGGTHYTLNDNNVNRLLKEIQDDAVMIDEVDSHQIFAHIVNTSNTMRITRLRKNKKNKKGVFKKKKAGSFFKYFHKLDFDLSKYGIYKKEDDKDYSINCIIRALQAHKLNDKKIQKIKTMVINRCIPLCQIKFIAETMNLYITVRRINDHHLYKYGDSENEEIKLGLIDEHYFLIDNVEITSFSVKNYNNVKNKKKWFKISYMNNKRVKRDKSKLGIDSFRLIKLLIENKEQLLEEIDLGCNEIYNTQFYDKVKEFKTLEFDKESNCRPLIYEEPTLGLDILFGEKPKEKQIKFFDFETYKDKDNKHVPYLCYFVDEDGKELAEKDGDCFYGENCGKKMLKTLTEDTLLIAHNANYDYRFIMKYLFRNSLIEKGNSLMNGQGKFMTDIIIKEGYTGKKIIRHKEKNGTYTERVKEIEVKPKYKIINLQIKDSYKLISKPLRDFKKCFFDDEPNLDKEVMPYDLYNKKRIEKQYIRINTALKYVKKKDRKKFIENIDKWKLRKTIKKKHYYDIVKYSMIY